MVTMVIHDTMDMNVDVDVHEIEPGNNSMPQIKFKYLSSEYPIPSLHRLPSEINRLTPKHTKE